MRNTIIKTLLCIGVVVVMVLSLCSCGSSKDQTDNTDTPDSATNSSAFAAKKTLKSMEPLTNEKFKNVLEGKGFEFSEGESAAEYCSDIEKKQTVIFAFGNDISIFFAVCDSEDDARYNFNNYFIQKEGSIPVPFDSLEEKSEEYGKNYIIRKYYYTDLGRYCVNMQIGNTNLVASCHKATKEDLEALLSELGY